LHKYECAIVFAYYHFAAASNRHANVALKDTIRSFPKDGLGLGESRR